MYYLYQKSFTERNKENLENDFLKQCRVEVLQPRMFKLSLPGEKLNLNLLLSRFYFWLITFGKYEIYYLYYNEDIVHTSYVVPKCLKFSFMHNGDYEIGPCVTNLRYRRKGSYYFMLDYITSIEKYMKSDFYMIVRDTNEASVKGIEKAGFKKFGTVVKTRLCKNYKLEK